MSSQAKVALVTGSSSGIGEATVRLLSQLGYKVAVSGSKKEKVDRVCEACLELSPQKFQPLALVLDLSDPTNGELAVKKTVEHFGRLDVLVNNAGILLPTNLKMSDYEAYRKVMTLNTDSSVQTTLAAAEHLRASKGNLIFVSSVSSIKPSLGGYAYCMSKAAMTMLSRCMAMELAPDVRVNSVSPGPVLTPIFKMESGKVGSLMQPTSLRGEIASSEDIAHSIAYLISDHALNITGHDLISDGGYMLKLASEDAVSLTTKAMSEKIN